MEDKKTFMHHGATPTIFQHARQLRESMTPEEEVLWEALRKKRLDGFHFRRQHPVSKYVLDFYCHQAKLGIELDGKYHEDKGQQFYDEDRTANLQELGIKVIRFNNVAVLNDLGQVLEEIRKELKRVE